MKKFLKYFGTGVLFFLMSIVSSCFGIAAYYGFSAIGKCAGWEAIGLGVVSIVFAFLAGFVIFCMGLVPQESLERLQQKVKELEEKENDNN